jgi:hypothetical protein
VFGERQAVLRDNRWGNGEERAVLRGELFGMQGRGASCLGCKDEGRAVWDARTRGEGF